MMKYLSVLCFVVLCVTIKVQAEEVVPLDQDSQEKTFTFSVDLAMYNKYVCSGTVLDDGQVYQQTLTMSHSSGFYTSLWMNEGQHSMSEGSPSSNEADWSLGWSGDVGPLQLDAGIVYYDMQFFKEKAAINYLAPYVEVSKEIEQLGGLTPYLKLEADYATTRGDEDGGGFQVTPGFRIDKELSEDLTVSLDCGVILDDGVYGSKRNEVLFSKIGLGYTIGHVTFGPEVAIYHVMENRGDRGNDLTNVVLGFVAHIEY